MTDKCRSCGKPIEWATTPKGHRVPLDPEPVASDAHGALILVPSHLPMYMSEPWAYGLSVLVERMVEQLGVEADAARTRIAVTYEARLSHFATCPEAGKWRRNAKSGGGQRQPNS